MLLLWPRSSNQGIVEAILNSQSFYIRELPYAPAVTGTFQQIGFKPVCQILERSKSYLGLYRRLAYMLNNRTLEWDQKWEDDVTLKFNDTELL